MIILLKNSTDDLSHIALFLSYEQQNIRAVKHFLLLKVAPRLLS
jgi:hypothetical protein